MKPARRLDWKPAPLDWALMALIVAWGVARLWPGLAHESIWPFDESFHQVVARHTFDRPLKPMLYVDALHDSIDTYWNARVWLVKPPGAFWTAALFMALVGKVPLAFRLGGLLSQLVAALTVYLLGKFTANRLVAFIAALGLLALPMGWTYTQARFIGDELDLELCGWLCVAMLCLFRAIETRSLTWAALAGAATGAGFLVKLVLALTPLGVAGVLWVSGLFRVTAGPRFKQLLVMGAVALAVALPWNLHAGFTWPEAYKEANADMLVHIVPSITRAKAPQWTRPADGVFNEIVNVLYAPMPNAVGVLAGVWLLLRAVRSRDFVLAGMAAWLWATWLGHSAVPIKIHSHLWNSVVPEFLAVALVLRDAWKSLPLAGALLGGLATELAVTKWKWLASLRELAPAGSQSRNSDLLAGLALVLAGVVLGALVHLLLRKKGPLSRWAFGLGVSGWLASVLLVTGPEKQRALAEEAKAHFDVAYSKTVGQALDRLADPQAVVMLDRDFDATSQIENHNLMFWSDRLVFGGRDPKDYPAAGYHPYLVSPNAEHFEPLAVPTSAWLRAYDLTRPLAQPAPIPEGLEPLDVWVSNQHVLGFGHEPSATGRERYAFIVAPGGPPPPMKVRFTLEQGEEVVTPLSPLRHPQNLARTAWYVLPVVGPAFAQVKKIDVVP